MDTFELVAQGGQEFRSPSTQTWVIRLSFPILQYTRVEFLRKDHLETFLAMWANPGTGFI